MKDVNKVDIVDKLSNEIEFRIFKSVEITIRRGLR
jgi:hypothetical protein